MASFVPDPSRHVPISPDLKCGEEWITSDHEAYCDEESDEDHYGQINFYMSLPHANNMKLIFNCRDKSSGVLLDSEPKVSKSEAEDNHVANPFFFEKSYSLEAATGFQPWPGSRLMVEAFTCDMKSEKTDYWQERLSNKDLSILEVGAGVGMVGVALAAAGGRVIISDLPVLTKHGIIPNLKRNGQHCEDPSQKDLGLIETSECFRIGRGYAQATVLDWTKAVSEQLPQTTSSNLDVIVGCDCLFLRKLVDPLLSIVSTLFEQTPKCKFLFTYQRRNMMGLFIGLEELLKRIDQRGWSVECLAWRTIHVEDDGEHELYLFEASPTLDKDLQEEKKDDAST